MPNPLEATIEIAAPPERVWAVLSDLKRMPEFSPDTIRMVPLGTVRAGTWTVNLNHNKYYYPTSSRILRFEPDRVFSFRMNENRTIWSYTLEPTASGTRVTERREVPDGVAKPVRVMINALLGGEQEFESGLVAGMNETLSKIKTAVES
ncbi:SRPBCC family protein [Nocardia macrotermitis]|uniref:SRPBCC family protein n=1 Tax=Nocardia macrotermitis TaxID=2585198 RepID=UPI0012975CDA|nr:SRPBCC family protein [Nocardia macrotermitis]